MDRPLVSLITDFGHSEYVASMKAAIWRECHECRVVDFFHDVHHGAILQGAHLLVKTQGSVRTVGPSSYSPTVFAWWVQTTVSLSRSPGAPAR
jgi:S-adenosylmethionine hydrolase